MTLIDSKKLESLIAEHTNEELAENKIGCKEIVIHQDGKCVYEGVFGNKSVGGEKAEKGLIYRAASMTKPITTVAVLQLVSKGLLSLDDKISSFFPKAKNLKVAKVENEKIVDLFMLEREIKVRNLLSHTSGIGCEPICNIVPCNNYTLSLTDAVDDILSKPLSFQPDSMQCYSATEAFDVAAGIVEKVSDISFDEYLKENIFSPLGMMNTAFKPTNEQWGKIVSMHNLTKDGTSEDVLMPNGCVFGDYSVNRMPAGAGLVTTAEDYIRFANMLCLGGKSADGKVVLPEKELYEMSTPQLPTNIENWCEKWGLGVRIVVREDYSHGLGLGCFGWSGAYGTHFWVDRENRISAVMMKNSFYDGGAGNKSACQLEEDVINSLK